MSSLNPYPIQEVNPVVLMLLRSGRRVGGGGGGGGGGIASVITVDTNSLNRLGDAIREKRNKTWNDIDCFVRQFRDATQFLAGDDAVTALARDPILRKNNEMMVSLIAFELGEIPMFLATKETDLRKGVERAKTYQTEVNTIKSYFVKTVMKRVKKVSEFVA